MDIEMFYTVCIEQKKVYSESETAVNYVESGKFDWPLSRYSVFCIRHGCRWPHTSGHVCSSGCYLTAATNYLLWCSLPLMVGCKYWTLWHGNKGY